VEVLARQVTVPPELAGKRLDQAAALLIADFSRSRLKRWIEDGQLTVDGARAAPKSRLQGGETLQLDAELQAAVPVAPEPIELNIVYADEAILVLDKPAGLVVHPGAGNAGGTLQNALLHFDPELAAVPRAGIVHRIDKETSGLLVIARTIYAQTALSAQIEARAVQRCYIGVCQGAMTGGGVVDAPLDRHPQDRKKMAVREGGRHARTSYIVRERFRAHTCLELKLDTGRTHQIRVHMAHIRSPLVGDPVYGGRPRLPKQPSAALRLCLQQFPRQALHAARLSLQHPDTGETLSFDSPVPADIETLLDVLRSDTAAAAAAAR
jgi:23S rRNA pseudouridine1911/1915/1917 synthase